MELEEITKSMKALEETKAQAEEAANVSRAWGRRVEKAEDDLQKQLTALLITVMPVLPRWRFNQAIKDAEEAMIQRRMRG